MGSITAEQARRELYERDKDLPDIDFLDLTATRQMKVGATYRLVQLMTGLQIQNGGVWKVKRIDEKGRVFGVKASYHKDHKGTPLRDDGLWEVVADPSTAQRPGFDEWALSLAVAVAARSRDPSAKVGAVIIRDDKTICSMGYNGFPRQMEDRHEWWNDRPQKYARVIHAEMNAIMNSKEPVTGMTLYVTHPVCEHCAKHIAAAGIRRVVWITNQGIRERFDIEQSLEILGDCGVQIREIEDGRNNHNASTDREGAEASTCKTC